jgi:hypothetical protein
VAFGKVSSYVEATLEYRCIWQVSKFAKIVQIGSVLYLLGLFIFLYSEINAVLITRDSVSSVYLLIDMPNIFLNGIFGIDYRTFV